MSLCLINVHGDIEGDFEWVEDLPKDSKEFLIAIVELEKLKSEIFWSEITDKREYITYWKALNHCCEIIDKHIAELKGE